MWSRVNPVRAGLIAAVVAIVAVAAAILLPSASFAAHTTDFHAELANASGLRQDDPVYVAGVPAGRVTGLELSGDRVTASFRLDNGVALGTGTRASVKLLTVLGRRYLSVEPDGPGRLRPGDTIPLARTSVPYLLDDLGRDAERTGAQLDVGKLRQALGTVTSELPSDPAQLARALDGVTAVSSLVNDDDQRLSALLSGARQVTGALLAQKDTLVALLGDADLVLRTLTDRRAAVEGLITDVTGLITTANRLLADHGPDVTALVNQAGALLGTLGATKQNLLDTIDKLAPTARYIANATGNGTWADVAGPAGPLPDNVLCLTGLARGCK